MSRAVRRGAAGFAAAVVGLLLAGCSTPAAAPAAVTASTTPAPDPTPTPTPSPTLAHSIDDPASIWVIVDKRRPLHPKSWVPHDLVTADVPHSRDAILRKPAARALERMVADAAADGVHLKSLSPYRPYVNQKAIYQRNVAKLGQAATDRLTARPGFSEHQTGLAVDLGDTSGRCAIQTCFGASAAGEWLAANAWRDGFVQRYPKGYRHVTGIQWEPWHYRYVGKALAKKLHDTATPTLEQWFGLPDAPHYR